MNRDGWCTSPSRSNRIPIWVAVTATISIFSLTVVVILITPSDSIEGNWRNHSLASCMCDSYNFLEFKDGRIRFISDTHLSGEIVGTYRQTDKGEFELEFTGSTATPLKFEIEAKNLHFLAPGSHMKPFDHFLGRLFYRPLNSEKAGRIGMETVARNRRIKESAILMERLRNGEDPSTALE